VLLSTIHLTLMIGPGVPLPAPPMLTEALASVEVRHSDEGRSGFQLVFHAGRGGPLGALDSPVVANPLLMAFSRVILLVTIGVMPRVIMDGIITHRQYSPGSGPGQATFTVIGEDVSVMMDQEEKTQEHPAQMELVIANKLIAMYAQYGMIPTVIPPPVVDVPIPIERTPVQQATDLGYLKEMAARYGYVFYVAPGPAPMTNLAYWGPPIRVGVPQPAITVNMGAETNATITLAQEEALNPAFVEGSVQDTRSNSSIPVRTFASLRPPLAAFPSWVMNMQYVRKRQFRESGVNAMQAMGRAQGETEASSDTVKVEGELNAGRYGGILQPRGLVGVRGAGYMHDGLYYVKSVTHTLRRGDYRQKFTLTREGYGSTVPMVVP
jgi:hypothetical protein